MAEKLASAIKKWAIKKGARFYSYWFFPLNDKYGENLVSFYDLDGKIKFSADNLKCETDASSFPSGKLRETSRAKGVLLWDLSSPFIDEVNGTKILRLPSKITVPL